MTQTQTTSVLNREERRYLTKIGEQAVVDELMTKKDTAAFYKCSLRQIELLSAAGRIPKPVYLGASSPRWRRSELMAHLDSQQKAAGAQ
jgi:predicted DNA-binding transcriptional regulator AlpA